MPAGMATLAFGIWMTVLGIAIRYVDGIPKLVIWVIAGASAVVAVLAGIAKHDPDNRVPWRLLAGGLTLALAGSVAYSALPELLGWQRPMPSIADGLLIGMYPLLMAAMMIFVRVRSGGRDRGSLLDALILTSGLALLSWIFLIAPYVRDDQLSLLGKATVTAYPVGDILCLAVLVRLLTSAGNRVASVGLFVAGITGLLVSDALFAVNRLAGTSSDMPVIGWIVFFGGCGLAALHPSMVQLTRPGDAPAEELGGQRILLLALSALIAPAVLMSRGGGALHAADVTVIALLSGVTFVLVLARLAGIVSNHRLALARERGLREASAALVAAAGPDGVASAVRNAVTQLLPGDVAHRVVLAMAVTAAEDEDEAKAVKSRAEEDRGAGTRARIVPTRELDWAVAIRLTQFSTVLRCPLVLQDRPNGDPLVGVLHIGAPAWALRGLLHAIEVLASQVALALDRIELSAEVNRRNSEAYFRTLVLNTADVIIILDEDDRIRYASPSAEPVLGKEDLAGTPVADVIHPVDRARLTEVLAQVRADGGPEPGLDFRALGRRRQAVMVEMHLRDLRADPTVGGVVLTLRDVTERRQLERELTHQAFHDALTGLANRVLFSDRLEHALARGRRDGSVVGVLFIDLDDFKIINDTLGHAVGDQLLVGVAERISGALRADDTAARLGGDEFAALIENVQEPGAVEETAQRILAALDEPFLINGEALSAVASIGVTTTPEADNADDLLRQADLALYVAKGAGKRQWRRYQSDLHSAMVQRLELRSALDHAVNEGHFLLQYQPIVDLRTDETVAFEALVRWHHPQRGTVSPAEFIEVAEESGLIVPIGRWVLEEAVHTVAQWQRILPPGRLQYVSVNVSVRQFRTPGFVDEVFSLLGTYGVDPHSLMLEITETLLMRDDEQIWNDLAALRERGIRIAIDDFGTGYSSLGYLRQRPIDVLKIDKTFIDDMVDSPQQLALVSSIMGLAQTLNLKVVAEGIESAEHRDTLIQIGCPLGQGYLFSRPVSAPEAFTWLNAHAGVAA